MSQEYANSQEVDSRNGRKLTVTISGSRTGKTVILLHGTPGSRSGPKPRSSVLYRLGVCLVTYDRPGYGDSERFEGRSVVDAADDVEDIAKALGVPRLAVVGRSGGGPHALACAARLPHLVARASVLVGLAPANAAELNWYAGMVNSNIDEYNAAADRADLVRRLELLGGRTMMDPENLIEHLWVEMTEADRSIVGDAAMRKQLLATYAEALKHGPYGWIDDVLALRHDWGFDPAEIHEDIPVLLWHGAEDNFSPASHTEWLARRIKSAQLQVAPGRAHFAAMEILPDMLPWLVDWDTQLAAANHGSN